MDDSVFGSRDKRGQWTPHKRPSRAPLFVWPAQPKKFFVWMFGFPGYLWPWNTLLMGISVITWLYLIPAMDTMRELSISWAVILLRNATLAILVYGGLHTLLYIYRRQGINFKYNSKWPDTDNSVFLFRSQTADNAFRTMCSGVPVWTAYELLAWWAYSNGHITQINIQEHPVYFVALILFAPAWSSLHFYVIHRLIHIGPLYHVIHRVHHNSVNPGPWSGLSMHTFEHIIYFSGALFYFIVPSHPMNVMFFLMLQALQPALGHLGFHKVVAGRDKHFDYDNYYHYLHHRYFEVNYTDTLIPFDEWFGTSHDGSPEADEAMYKRMKEKKFKRGGSKT
ncbi:desaturase [Mesorhizobium sp. WSM3866]|uniref:sterol desaturase family protein n=1 Tax=Mesorhizobium sp. WSM3866 TaxID=422271 RepID=UPI000BB04A18|nr:sterol desaturase family protein [Mesorhizobium sp. WSM3866]PBB39983.1 desaturase [Mesorhizobium sp. WSM3866]